MQNHHEVLRVDPDGAGTRLERTVDIRLDNGAPRMPELMAAGEKANARALA